MGEVTCHDIAPAEDNLRWIRKVAEARWAAGSVLELPWWVDSNATIPISVPIDEYGKTTGFVTVVDRIE
jgi:hypothetical protein